VPGRHEVGEDAVGARSVERERDGPPALAIGLGVHVAEVRAVGADHDQVQRLVVRDLVVGHGLARGIHEAEVDGAVLAGRGRGGQVDEGVAGVRDGEAAHVVGGCRGAGVVAAVAGFGGVHVIVLIRVPSGRGVGRDDEWGRDERDGEDRRRARREEPQPGCRVHVGPSGQTRTAE
jgi:hypothetical protein